MPKKDRRPRAAEPLPGRAAGDSLCSAIQALGDVVGHHALSSLFPDLRRNAAAAAETVVFKHGQGTATARLFAVPVVVAGETGEPEAELVADAFERYGLLPTGGEIAVSREFYDARALSALPLAARTALARWILLGERSDAVAAAALKPGDGRAVLLGAAVSTDGDATSWLAEADEGDVRAARCVILHSGGGIVDVGRPCELEDLESASEDWLVEAAGARDEVDGFFSVAAREVGRRKLECVVRRVGRSFAAELRAGGRLVDERLFDPFALPMSGSELEHALRLRAGAFREDAPTAAPTIQARQRPIPPRRKPILRLVGGASPRRKEGAETIG